ncbi:unnamed protein product [Absidia cylindrospora]
MYDKATYILAVPDLHVTYLKGVSIKNDDTIAGSNKYCINIYHLLHGHASQLAALDELFLDDVNVPKDPPELRQLLLQNTNYFAYGFMNYHEYHHMYCPLLALDHICETTQERHRHWKTWIKGSKKSNGDIHQCDETICPLGLFFARPVYTTFDQDCEFNKSKWKSKIIERSNSIRQSMEFLVGLVKDWSTRVWVISEFNIAKRKNNLKYWFTQLALNIIKIESYQDLEFTFFKFDFNDPSLTDTSMHVRYYQHQHATEETRTKSSNPVYIQFHDTLNRQLSRQTFLENILISKASKNEDRFYSILPFSPYQDRKREMAHWKINTMPSVKLKLYEIMHTKDKLKLLFLSGDEKAMCSSVLPTFATSTLASTSDLAHLINGFNISFSNFDTRDPSTIMLYHHEQPTKDEDDEDDDDSHNYYLRLKPKEYIVAKHDELTDRRIHRITRNRPLLKRLGLHDALTFDLVSIPMTVPNDTHSSDSEWSPSRSYRHEFLTLIGCFVRNKWILSTDSILIPEEGHHVICDDDDDKPPVTFFDIY